MILLMLLLYLAKIVNLKIFIARFWICVVLVIFRSLLLKNNICVTSDQKFEGEKDIIEVDFDTEATKKLNTKSTNDSGELRVREKVW